VHPVRPSAVLRLGGGALALSLAAGTASPAGAASVPAAAPVTSASIAAQVRALDQEVDRVGTALAAGVARYQQAQDRLARSTQDRMTARDEVEARQAEAQARRASFGGLARAAYKGGVPSLVTALLSGDPRTVSDLAYVQRSVAALGVERRADARLAEQRQHDAALVLARSDDERRDAVALRQAVDAELAALLAEADRLTDRLAVTADALAAARADEAARDQARELAARQARERATRAAAPPLPGTLPGGLVGTPPSTPPSTVPSMPSMPSMPSADGSCGPPSTLGEANGFLPSSTLCPLSTGRGHRLRTDAAQAYEQLQAAYAASLGRPLCVTDSYRSYPAQVDVFARKPSLAAVPGTSQHGWGLALDLCGGVQVFGSEAHEWMRAYAPAFGWHHPQWAREGGRKPEPWHWEFSAGQSRAGR
jgi:peptidoglycan hydrolase CwlO-like protein